MFGPLRLLDLAGKITRRLSGGAGRRRPAPTFFLAGETAIRQVGMALLVAAAFGGLAGPASAQLVNGNFEGGSFIPSGFPQDTIPNGWTNGPPSSLSLINVTNATGAAPLGPRPGSTGSFYVRFQSPQTDSTRDCLFQDMTTVAGQAYNVSFWVAITSTSVGNTLGLNPVWDENTPNQSTMGANQFYFTPTNTGPVNYQFFSFTETASTALTRIDFHGIDANGSILLDDVSVTPVPEPSGLALLCLTVTAGFCGWRFHRPRKGRPSAR
jgi:hypothetical protein